MMEERNPILQLLRYEALRDERRAFSLFFTNYYPRLMGFAKMFLSNRSMAEDTVSEVMIRLMRRSKELFFMENFEGYIFQAVKNEALNILKSDKLKRAQSIEEASGKDIFDLMDPHEKLTERELRHCVHSLIEQLPPKRKRVYELIKNEGMRYKDVAKLMDISERTVEVHLKIAVHALRTAVVNHLKEPRATRYLSTNHG